MTVDFFKHKYGYEIEGMWMPRVTAITALTSRPFFAASFRSAHWGTAVHEAIEKILKGESNKAEEKIAPSLVAFEQWRKDQGVKIVNPIEDIECRVYDFEHGYAGTIDMVADVQGKRGVVDIKTGNAMRDEYSLQTAAYLGAYNNSFPKNTMGKKKERAKPPKYCFKIEEKGKEYPWWRKISFQRQAPKASIKKVSIKSKAPFCPQNSLLAFQTSLHPTVRTTPKNKTIPKTRNTTNARSFFII